MSLSAFPCLEHHPQPPTHARGDTIAVPQIRLRLRLQLSPDRHKNDTAGHTSRRGLLDTILEETYPAMVQSE